MKRNLISIQDLTRNEILEIIELTYRLKNNQEKSFFPLKEK